MSSYLEMEREGLLKELSDVPLDNEQKALIQRSVQTMDYAQVRDTIRSIRSMKLAIADTARFLEELKKKEKQ